MKIYIIGPEFKIATLQYELKIKKKKKIPRLIARWISNITAFYSEGFNCRRKKIKRFISILAGHA
jgi:hypothetical protein